LSRTRLAKLVGMFLVVGLMFSMLAGCGASKPTQPAPAPASGDKPAEPTMQVLRFYFPVGVAGPLAQKMSNLVEEFNKSQTAISVEAVFTGDYAQTFQKALTAHVGGNPPDIALITSSDVWSLRDAKAIITVDDFIAKEGGDQFLADFYPGFLGDVRYDGKLWGIPFQKSTPVFYWNKVAFKEAGLDPEKPPTTWDELRDYARKLTIKDGSNVKRWGLEIPMDQWLLSAFILQNGGKVNNDKGTEMYLDSPEAIGALQFLADLSIKENVMPAKRLFGDSGQDFVAGQTAMMYNSPGSMTFVRDSAKFEFGVAPLPKGKKQVSPTGGGQLVLFAKTADAHKQAAWTFAKWLTSKENSARWMAESGYMAVRKSAVDVPVLADYMKGLPQAKMTFEAVKYAEPEAPATHDGRKVAQTMTSALEQAMAGKATPEQALKEAQTKAMQILSQFK
jgi:sn-glycerol 3-phosphate transport system substrate-binding protein